MAIDARLRVSATSDAVGNPAFASAAKKAFFGDFAMLEKVTRPLAR